MELFLYLKLAEGQSDGNPRYWEKLKMPLGKD